MNDTSLVSSNYEQAVNVLRKVSGKVDFVIDPYVDPATETSEEEEEEEEEVPVVGQPDPALPAVEVTKSSEGGPSDFSSYTICRLDIIYKSLISHCRIQIPAL